MLRLTTFSSLNPTAAERQRIGLPYETFNELDTLRRRNDIDFVGKPIADFLAFGTTIKSLKTMQADTSHDGGMRIRFQQHATYSSLVAV